LTTFQYGEAIHLADLVLTGGICRSRMRARTHELWMMISVSKWKPLLSRSNGIFPAAVAWTGTEWNSLSCVRSRRVLQPRQDAVADELVERRPAPGGAIQHT
jgi:hypothetical protein